jgi:hypothetical protein
MPWLGLTASLRLCLCPDRYEGIEKVCRRLVPTGAVAALRSSQTARNLLGPLLPHPPLACMADCQLLCIVKAHYGTENCGATVARDKLSGPGLVILPSPSTAPQLRNQKKP